MQDTAWEGYKDIPAAIIDGYDTLFHEIDDQLDGIGATGPALVVVPTGVGSLLHAALIHYRSRASHAGTAVVSVEPEGAACVQASLAEGTPVTVDTGTTIMAGLNCGTPSSTAWPFIVRGLDAATTVSDTAATAAAHTLASYGVDAGPCGAASLAALEVLLPHETTTAAAVGRNRRGSLIVAPVVRRAIGRTVTTTKARGKVRMEGKDYVMHDDDVVEFRFNV